MKTKAIGSVLRWHIEGTLNETAEGVVLSILKWPITGSVRAYVVSRDHPTIKVSIIQTIWVVEEK